MSRIVKIISVGQMSYRKCLRLQNLVSEDVKKERNANAFIVVVEHDPVYTVGIREKQYTREEESKLLELGADFHRVDRGGLITFHGPGQLVAYPILDLRNYKLGVREYVKRLEHTVIDLCKTFSIDAHTSPHTGVWVDDMKICALGIRVSRYVTTHGLALNCNVDLNWFDHIVPCGIVGKKVTSLSQQLRANVTVDEALPRLKDSFRNNFYNEFVDMDDEEKSNLLKRLDEP